MKMNNPNSKNEFKINKYVTLRIIGKEVHIYVGRQEFRQCKGYKTVPNQNVGEVSIEDELWFYSSVIQGWFEHNFYSENLPIDFEFSLLFELQKLGMTEAKEALLPRIYKRYKEGDDKVRLYLIIEGYMGYLLDNRFKIEDLRNLIEDKKVLQEFDKFISYYIKISS